MSAQNDNDDKPPKLEPEASNNQCRFALMETRVFDEGTLAQTPLMSAKCAPPIALMVT